MRCFSLLSVLLPMHRPHAVTTEEVLVGHHPQSVAVLTPHMSPQFQRLLLSRGSVTSKAKPKKLKIKRQIAFMNASLEDAELINSNRQPYLTKWVSTG